MMTEFPLLVKTKHAFKLKVFFVLVLKLNLLSTRILARNFKVKKIAMH